MATNEEIRTAPQPQLSADGFIGVFDSGVGGVSVLRALVDELPSERFVYFGDSAHAPYGDKSEEWVRKRSHEIVEQFVEQGCKAVVIACNTATSAAAASLRATYPQLPIIGVEPALKPAALAPTHDRILVMATRTTLDLDKFHALAREYGSDSIVYTQACPGLADAIELGDFESDEFANLLDSLIGKYADLEIDSVVLGCTHYAFIKPQITRVVGDVAFFDGAVGTAQHVHRVLQEKSLLAPGEQTGSVEFRSSAESSAQQGLYARLFELSQD